VRNVSPELRAKVEASAAALGYATNLLAQGIARGLSETVAVVVGSIADPYFAGIVAGVTEVAEASGMVVTIITTGGDREREASALLALKGQRPRHLIMTVSRSLDPQVEEHVADELRAYERMGGTVVFVGSGLPGFRGLVVAGDAAAGRLARALIGRGYRRFAVLTGPAHLEVPVHRARGFIEVVEEAGGEVPERFRVASPINRHSGREAMRAVLSAGDPPECVFAIADVLAVGAVSAIREAGLEPGRDIGVAGFDDVELLEDMNPSLTTVHLPLVELGARAVRLAAEQAPRVEHIEAEVMLRASTPGPTSRV